MNYEKWAFHDISPISQQLIQKLKYAILSNELSCGEGIPSVREMAEWLHINPNTVLKSYKVLSRNSLLSVLQEENISLRKTGLMYSR